LKLPRDLSGDELTKLLRRFGYAVTRQAGSHIRATSRFKGREHHVTIPAHKELKLGTLAEILGDVAAYLEMTREALAEQLFGS
jgi:predicted RNA binding protein YcfA (HicA-like mRNA interferase family)